MSLTSGWMSFATFDEMALTSLQKGLFSSLKIRQQLLALKNRFSFQMMMMMKVKNKIFKDQCIIPTFSVL